MNREKVISFLTSSKATSYIDSLRQLFKDFPHLPLSVTQVLVNVMPWLIMLSATFGAINGVQEILYASGITQFGNFVDSDVYLFTKGVLELVSAYLGFLAFSLLRQKSHTGWVLLFWNTVVSMLMAALSLIYGIAAVVSVILTVVLGLYIMFEVEPLYNVGVKTEPKIPEKTQPVAKTAKSTKKSAKRT